MSIKSSNSSSIVNIKPNTYVTQQHITEKETAQKEMGPVAFISDAKSKKRGSEAQRQLQGGRGPGHSQQK